MTSRRAGRWAAHEVRAAPDDLVLAEGIFAADIVPALRGAGILYAAWCIHHHPTVTFVRRLTRDLAQRRKAPRCPAPARVVAHASEPAIVERLGALGAVSAHPADVETHAEDGAGERLGCNA